MKGNTKDCICEKSKGKHREHCDAYRLSEFIKKAVAVTSTHPPITKGQKG